ncbi:hypothetical protein B0T26DRAFT_732535 [Lasiosphaeria miniovina]|uniref:Uncharacterized protein n=1 Tax=Lasiosphaeria miniovina TaxID=1954250 RepID=A0AA39ZU81_9PEZI|nr:uncharacterized protein B0T26DRAFT_732535 [Lasiosphaeria miniovina]KAK0703753.1 hypothetical protein B0T26DRAFT_732535 [Lasiosphaeria miniovina]
MLTRSSPRLAFAWHPVRPIFRVLIPLILQGPVHLADTSVQPEPNSGVKHTAHGGRCSALRDGSRVNVIIGIPHSGEVGLGKGCLPL